MQLFLLCIFMLFGACLGDCTNAGVCECLPSFCGEGWGWSDRLYRCVRGETTSPHALQRGRCGQDTIRIELEGFFSTEDTEKGTFYGGKQFTINKITKQVKVLDLEYPKFPKLIHSIDTSDIGIPASIDVGPEYVVLGIADSKQLPGYVALYENKEGYDLVTQSKICYGPGEVKYDRSFQKIVVLCEGEPSEGYNEDPALKDNPEYEIDPPGEVFVIDLTKGVGKLQFTKIEYPPQYSFPAGSRLFPSPLGDYDLEKDLEPEFCDFDQGTLCYIVFQENNLMGVLDVETLSWSNWWVFGSKQADPFDGNDEDKETHIVMHPGIEMLFVPDTVRFYVPNSTNGKGYLVTTNEGDSREYEQSRIGDDKIWDNLDETVFDKRLLEDIKRYYVSNVPQENDLNGDGKVDRLLGFGGRSISIWSPEGELIWDSGALFEETIAHRLPYMHNSNRDGDPDSYDRRSDEQGPEPDSLAVGQLRNGKWHAFVGMERAGGTFALDISDPRSPTFATYFRYTGVIAPERTDFVPPSESTNGYAWLVDTGERSGTTAVYRVVESINCETSNTSMAVDAIVTDTTPTTTTFGVRPLATIPPNAASTIVVTSAILWSVLLLLLV